VTHQRRTGHPDVVVVGGSGGHASTVTIGVHENPGDDVGTMMMEIPLCLGRRGRSGRPARCSRPVGALVKDLVALITHSSPVELGTGRSDARSVPAPARVADRTIDLPPRIPRGRTSSAARSVFDDHRSEV